MLKLKLGDRPCSAEREVEYNGTKFTIKIRTPNLEERFRFRSMIGQDDGSLIAYAAGFLIGWDGLADEKSEPIPFNELMKAKILDGNYVIADLIGGTITRYFHENVVEIITEDDAKNSEQPPGQSTEVATPTVQPLPSIVT